MASRLLSLNHYRRTLIALAVLIAMLALSFLAQTAYANFVPGYEDRRYFYSDPEKTNLVGGLWFDCNQELHTWGVQSGYATTTRTKCPVEP